ncbi:hypothetical protein D9M68_499330 [compost metagenome]
MRFGDREVLRPGDRFIQVGFDEPVFARVHRVVPLAGHVDGLVADDIDLLVAAIHLDELVTPVDGDLLRPTLVHRQGVRAVDGLVQRSVARVLVGPVDEGGALALHRVRLVVLHLDRQILLRMDLDRLAPRVVVDDEVVGQLAVALDRAADEPTDRRLGRQLQRRHLVGVVDAPDDDRPVGAARDEIDDHLLPHARMVHGAEVGAGPGTRHAHPARAVFVALAVAVPAELHLHAAVLVDPDVFAGRPDHGGGLRALRARHARDAARAERERGGLHAEMKAVLARHAAAGVAAFAQAVHHRDDEVLAVVLVARCVLHGEAVAGRHAAHVGVAGVDLGLGLRFFEADARVVLALPRVAVAAHPLVHLVAAVVVAARLAARVEQVGPGLLEVEVVDHVGAGADLFGDFPLVDHFAAGVGGAVAREVADLRVAGQRLVRAHVVGQHQRVLVLVVLEVVVDALVLHEAAHEGEVGLLVLHAVLPLAVRGAELLLEGEAVLAQHVFKNLDDRLVLEDLAVAGAREVPQPGPHRGAVHGVARGAALAPDHGEARDLAVEVARRAAQRLDLQRERLAEQALHVDRGVRAQQVDLELEQLRQPFAAVHRAEQQLFFSKRGVGFDDSVHAALPWVYAGRSENSYWKSSPAAPSCTPASLRALTVAPMTSSLSRGRMVCVRIASIIRPPDSMAVQRRATSATALSL